jgi:hypothetical protein
MNRKLHADAAALMREIARYLAVVDAFRAELCEPTWLPEPTPSGAAGALSARAGTTADARTSHHP